MARVIRAPLSAEEADRRSRRYFYWLLVVIFFEYARPASFVPFLRIPFLYSLIPLALLVAQHFAVGLRPYREIFTDRLAKWPVVMLALILIGMFSAILQRNAWSTFTLVLGFVFLFVMVARIVTSLARLRGVIAVLLVSHLFLLAMNPNVILDPTQRQYILGASFLGDGNDFSLSLCILLPLTLELARSRTKFWPRLLTWAGLAVLLLAAIATQSRGGTLGISAVLVFLWLFSPRKAIGVIGVALAGVAVLIYAPPQYFDRIKTIGSYQEDGSAQGRLEAWKSSINMALDNPVFGVGAGSFGVAFGTKYRTPGAANMPWLTAHSSYFLVLGEMGIPGIICILAIVLGNVIANLRLRKAVLARAGPKPAATTQESVRVLLLTAGGFVGFSIAGAFLSAAYYPHIFVLTGLLVATRCIVAQREGLDMSVLSGKRLPLRRPRQPASASPESSPT
jgi:probable O-glycosylation ligase (exosortase A-associated)